MDNGVKINMRIEQQLLDDLDKMAAYNGRSRSAEVRQLIIGAVRRHRLIQARRRRIEHSLLSDPDRNQQPK